MTLKGGYERRPDIVLYVNGIAVGGDRTEAQLGGSRPMACANSSPTKKRFSTRTSSSTVQLLLAGSDSQGLRYGTVDDARRVLRRMEGTW